VLLSHYDNIHVEKALLRDNHSENGLIIQHFMNVKILMMNIHSEKTVKKKKFLKQRKLKIYPFVGKTPFPLHPKLRFGMAK